jgi:N-acyl amino acid synthase of PEP-CTERM/exosortase system
MNATEISGEISIAARQFTLERATTVEQLREVFRLRHQVYCVERGFEAVDGEEETDEFDCRSRHVLLREASSGAVVGTVRVIAPDPHADPATPSLPMQGLCDPAQFRHLPAATTGEISRFAISKQRRMSCTAASFLRVALMRGIVQLSAELGLTHWLAVMEPSLIRLHQRSAIHFQPIGPLVSYHGIRQPTFGVITAMLSRIRREQWPVWSYLTGGGQWFGEPGELALTA